MNGRYTGLLERFLRYVRIDTQSSESSETTPSTAGQWELIRLLEGELKELGLKDVRVTEHGYVLAAIPGNTRRAAPRLAFLAHVDTAQDFPGAGVRPMVHEGFDGKPIVLPDDPTQVLDFESGPQLRDKAGETIITASGKTLLGADNKAGIAVIMTAAEELIRRPEIEHGPIRICFNPDEEVGRGVEKLDLKELDADAAYTLDAGSLGEIQYESFSADKAVVTITGVSIHPGWAKGRMVNAVHLAGKLLAALPREGVSPETSDGRGGFIHPYGVEGDPARTVVRLILRDFELEGLAEKGERLKGLCAGLAACEPRARISCEISRQYRNMRYWLEKDMRPVEFAREAMRARGIAPLSSPVRGGTDGSNLTARGLPTPNLFCGDHNSHGPLEWVSLQDMEKSVGVVVELAKIWGRVG